MDNQSFFTKLRRFDAYPKTLEDFRVKTFGGAAGELSIKHVKCAEFCTGNVGL